MSSWQPSLPTPVLALVGLTRAKICIVCLTILFFFVCILDKFLKVPKCALYSAKFLSSATQIRFRYAILKLYGPVKTNSLLYDWSKLDIRKVPSDFGYFRMILLTGYEMSEKLLLVNWIFFKCIEVRYLFLPYFNILNLITHFGGRRLFIFCQFHYFWRREMTGIVHDLSGCIDTSHASLAGSLPRGAGGPLFGDSWHCDNWPLKPAFCQFTKTEYVFSDISNRILSSVTENSINEYLNCGDSFFLFYQLSCYQRLLQQLMKKEDAFEEDWCFSMMALPTRICQLFSSVSKA